MSHRRVLVLLAVLLAAVPVVLIARGGGGEERERRAEARCETRGGGERAREEEREREGRDQERGGDAAERIREARTGEGAAAVYAGGPRPVEPRCGEVPGLPESYADLALANSTRAARDVAPGTTLRAGARRAALAQKARLRQTGGPWTPYGRTPVETGRTEYDTTNGSTRQGLGNISGRINVLVRDPADGRLFAGPTEGGVFTSTDGGERWTSIGDTLATQSVSGLAWTTAGGGTLLALTGDNSFGGGTTAGLGAYWTTDLGQTWHHATGIPDGLLAFRLAVDPTDPQKVYAATGGGLFRSTDGGRSYENVGLPVGDCAGKAITVKGCALANMVTDVVVQGPGNAKTPNGTPGAVLAAVGWRGGTKKNADGSVQSPGNGLYRSDSGAPGSFTDLDFAAHALPKTDPLTQARIGRIALGAATGPAQDQRVVYAIVQDAVKFNGGLTGLDANENGKFSALQSDYLNGIWASTDFGRTWSQLEGSTVIDADLTSNSALAPPVCKLPGVVAYCPGIQAWYNLQIAPDPTRQSPSGIPTRLAFGLEEVWEMNDLTGLTGLDGILPAKAQVIGRYYAGDACTLITATNGLPVCPVAEGGKVPATTTHPDQHALLWVPGADGAVTLYAGNDGGVYRQSVAAGQALSNTGWGTGANSGLNTLQAYDVALAKDGTAWMGLQDNGEAKVDPDGRSYTVFGGDGFFTAVDPDHSEIAYEEYTAGGVSVTRDGGKTWTSIDPGLTNPAFGTPFEMDPADATHLLIAGCDVRETTAGPDTQAGESGGDKTWRTVFQLGTRDNPGGSCPQDGVVNQASAVDVRTFPTGSVKTAGAGAPSAAYVGFCGYCDPITQGVPFGRGIATNVKGDGSLGKAGSGDGWHVVAAKGLPSRSITSIRMDPANPRTVYVTLGGYSRKWAAPGAVGDDTSQVGRGHVFRSTDAGETFTDISGTLPDAPANWSLVDRGRLLVATDLGVYASCGTTGGTYKVLGGGLPNVQVSTLQTIPGKPDALVAATYGRGLYRTTLTADPACAKQAAARCTVAKGFRSVRVTPAGAGLRFTVRRALKAPFTVDVFRESAGRRVLAERRVARFTKRTGSFTWRRPSRRVGNGVYVVRLRIAKGTTTDVRRLAFGRTNGRFHARGAYVALTPCKVLARARLTRPVAGGRTRRALVASARLTAGGSLTFTVTRGKRTLARKTVKVAGTTTRTLTVPAAKLGRGDVRVTVAAVRDGTKETARLFARVLQS